MFIVASLNVIMQFLESASLRNGTEESSRLGGRYLSCFKLTVLGQVFVGLIAVYALGASLSLSFINSRLIPSLSGRRQ